MIKNQLYPYIEKYINDYLYGFKKEQFELAITQGKLELYKINIRPDAINKIMNDINVPFWIKAGLINKIYVGISLMNLIGEIPLEVTIDGINIILSPSYKWINLNLKNSSEPSDFNEKNPIGFDVNNNDNFGNNFDVSIFNKTFIERIYKDKSLVSNVINSILTKLFDFYSLPNYAVILKINKLRIRIEDDQLFNYEGKFVLGIKIENIICKMGFKGTQKKNSLKIENVSVYWENNPKLIFPNDILNKYMIAEKIEDEYYKQINTINFNSIDDSTNNPNIKLIINNFRININFGTLEKEIGAADIFNIKDNLKKSYFQISSNELIINIYPEFLSSINDFSNFSSNFSIIDKIKNYRPYKRPYDKNKSNKSINKGERKAIVRKWLHYFVWRRKIIKKNDYLNENPIRAEFNRFYNIYHKKADVFQLLEEMRWKKEKEKNEKEIKNVINNTNNKGKKEYISNTKNDENEDERSLFKTKEEYEKFLEEKVKQKYNNFSSIIEILIKGVIINIHPKINRNIDINNNIIINFSGLEIKIEISPEQFNFNLGLNSLDIGQKDIISGERIILCPTSYRAGSLFAKHLDVSNKLIITPNVNSVTSIYEEEKRQAGITGLIRKFNPNHEEKIKIINEALDKVGEEPKYASYKIKNYEDSSMNYNINTTLRAQPNRLANSSIINRNFNFGNSGLRKSYATIIDNGGEQNYINNKSRKSSFAKNIIDNYNEEDLRLKQKLKNQKNDLDISQAINSYNTNKRKYTPINNMRNSSASNLMNSYGTIKLKANNKFILKQINIINNNKNNNVSPLNLMEIYSNTKIGALKLKYIKYNNSFSLDDFSIQIGTLRLHPFPQYIIDMITIYLDYQNNPKIPIVKRSQVKSTDVGGIYGIKQLLKMRQNFFRFLTDLQEDEKTESMKEYINYLNNEISQLLKFNDEIDIKPFFEINYLFSFFPKGIKFYFDYENIECVYYSKMEKVLGKFMISPYTINCSISLSKIIANIFGIKIEINNLKESKYLIEKLLAKCEKMLNEKKDILQFIIEPCYTTIKEEIINEGNWDNDIIVKINNSSIRSGIKKSINKLPNVKN